MLAEQELVEKGIELHQPKTPQQLRHRTAKPILPILKTQPGIKKFDHKIEKKNTPHTVIMKNDYLLWRSGVTFRYELEPEIGGVAGPS